MPGVVNVSEKLPPGLTVPESQRPGVSDVVVCGVDVVVFVHWTVVPATTVTAIGWKEKLTIETACVPPSVTVGVTVGLGVLVGGGGR